MVVLCQSKQTWLESTQSINSEVYTMLQQIRQHTHWLTVDESRWHEVEFYINNLVEEWWNPEEGEYALVNPHEAFLQKMDELGLPCYDCRD